MRGVFKMKEKAFFITCEGIWNSRVKKPIEKPSYEL